MTPTEKRKAQWRMAQVRTRKRKANEGYKLLHIPPALVKIVKELIKQYKLSRK